MIFTLKHSQVTARALLVLGGLLCLASASSAAQNHAGGASSGSSHAAGSFYGSSSHYSSSTPPFGIPTGPIHPPTGPVHPPTAGPRGGGFANNRTGHHRYDGSNSLGYVPYYYPYYFAVPEDDSDQPGNDPGAAQDDADYQGGPTVFDRRGSGSASYVPPQAQSQGSTFANASPGNDGNDIEEPPQTSTELVFKDGRQLEVSNYAIVNQTLFDLTPGHSRRVALADLDLQATEKQNEDRGVNFQLPPATQVN